MRRLAIRGEFLLALGIAGFGLFLAAQTSAIEVSPGYARVGPRVFPWVVSGALIFLGLWLAREAWSGLWQSDDSQDSAPQFDAHAFILIGLGLVLHMLLIGWRWGGFVVAATALFVCVARAFGSRSMLRDAGIGAVLALVVNVGFSYGLGLELPAGLHTGLL